jgi:hypothetical protein
MAEGEKLAGKQAEVEATVKKLRQQGKEADAERGRYTLVLSACIMAACIRITCGSALVFTLSVKCRKGL